MYIIDAIEQVDSLKPNSYKREDKIRWLSEIDGQIYEEVIKKHKKVFIDGSNWRHRETNAIFEHQCCESGTCDRICFEENSDENFEHRCATCGVRMEKREYFSNYNANRFTPYDDTTDIYKTRLIVPFPYDGLYVLGLKSRIDLNNEEYSKYNNDCMLFNAAYTNFYDWYNRENMPTGERQIHL